MGKPSWLKLGLKEDFSNCKVKYLLILPNTSDIFLLEAISGKWLIKINETGYNALVTILRYCPIMRSITS